MSTGRFVQYGAGYSAPEGWMNFDSSPTLRLQRVPLVGGLLFKMTGTGTPFPKGIRYGDIVKGLPVEAGSVEALYASHVLEHLPLDDMRKALKNSFDVLRPGGVFRLIVPDLAVRVRSYVDGAEAGKPDAAHKLLYDTGLGRPEGPNGLKARARVAFGGMYHMWMWDFPAMRSELESVGFIDVRRADMGDSGEPMFDRVEARDRFFDEHIEDEPVRELALQAHKPS